LIFAIFIAMNARRTRRHATPPAANQAAWILAGKLGPPRQRVNTANRYALLEQLERAHELPLTLITAPAGFGKSSLLAQWHQRLVSGERAHVAWLTLDEDDGEISRFVAYLVLAVSAAGVEVGALLQTAQAQLHEIDAKSSISALIGHIRAAPLPLTIILDDCDRITSPSVDALLRDLIEHADPRLKMILSGRERPSLPVSDLIVRGMALCLDASDLSLSLEEATQIFGGQLSPQALRQIHEHTEGWAVALQLAALWSAEAAPSGRHLLDGFSSSSRGTSILNRFDAALADAVLKTTDSARQLDRLAAFLGLVIPLDAAQRWFRYHHLFAEVLQPQLQRQWPDETPALHRRAARWLNDHGDLLEAVKHAIHAGEIGLAIDFITRAGGWALILDKGVGYVRPLLRHFTPEQIRGDPALNITQAYLHIKLGEFDQARHLLDRHADFPAHQQAACQSSYLTVRAMLDNYLDSIWSDPHWIGQMQSQIKALDGDGVVDATFHCTFALGELGYGNLDSALHHAQTALDGMRRVGSVVGTAYALFHLGQSHFYAGRLDQAEAAYREALLIAEQYFGVDSALKGYGRCMLAQVLYWRGEMVEARRTIDDGLPFLDGHDVWLDVFVSAWEAKLGITRQQGVPDALALLDDFEREANARRLPRLQTLVHGWRLDVLLELPELEAANRNVAEYAHEPALEYALGHSNHWLQQMALGLPLARWHARAGRSAVALALLQRLEAACAAGRSLHLARVRAHLALLLQQRGEVEPALTTFGTVLDAVNTQQIWQVPLELGRAGRTLFHLAQQRDPQARAGSSRSQTLHTLLEMMQGKETDSGEFSPREWEILAELSLGHSNKHIARGLNMSENTVKFHLKNIFRKLGVDTRTKAVAAAHARKLLP